MLKVLICGPVPSPIGGISIHIQRLALLTARRGVKTIFCDESATAKTDIFNIRSLKFFKYLRLVNSADVVHIHSSVAIFRLLHLLVSFFLRKRTVVTIHSWRNGAFLSFVWSKLLTVFSSRIVLVSKEISNHLLIPDKKLRYYPAFIPPINAPQPLPIEIEKFITAAKLSGNKIVSSNAFRILEHNNQDLYGLDLCIEAFSSQELSSVAVLIFSISDPEVNRQKIDQYQKYIDERNLGSVIYLQIGAIDFYSLLKLSDISVRATNTDGDALSVRESLFLNRPCVASNCTKRPEGTYLFENRSAPSLMNAIIDALRDTNPPPTHTESLQQIENFYYNLYAGTR